MGEYELKIVISIGALVLLFMVKFLLRWLINSRARQLKLSFERKAIVNKLTNLILIVIFFVSILSIWGGRIEDVALILSGIATVLGVAFFAQWSLLSNITASFILYFSHPIRIGSHVRILDKDFPIEGKVIDITSFFIEIRQNDGEKVIIPTAIMLQKSISVDNGNDFI